MQTNRSNVGTLIVGAILIGFGLLSLVGNIFRGFDWGFLWPFIVIGFGGLFFVAMFAMGKERRGVCDPRQHYQRYWTGTAFPEHHSSLGIHVLFLDVDHYVRWSRHIPHGLVRRKMSTRNMRAYA